MVRDATRLGFRIDAVALAGTVYLFSQWNDTFILSPAGSILSIVPTLTPMIWILSPGYSASVSSKYATAELVVSFLYSCQPTMPATKASTTTSAPMITEARETPLGSFRFRTLKTVDISYTPALSLLPWREVRRVARQRRLPGRRQLRTRSRWRRRPGQGGR